MYCWSAESKEREMIGKILLMSDLRMYGIRVSLSSNQIFCNHLPPTVAKRIR